MSESDSRRAESEPIAGTPPAPYWAVIFTSIQSDDTAGYAEAARRMVELAATRDGFLGIESARGADGAGITVSYWRDPEAAAAWKRDTEHREVQRLGRERWYRDYRVRVAHVEREYGPDRRARTGTRAESGGGSGRGEGS